MPLAATEIILTARPASGGTAAIRTAKANGDWIDEWIMTGDWEVFRPSPSRQYLLGGNGSTSGVLIRQNDRAVIWQGSLFEAAFAPDDQHMIVSPNNSSNALTIVEMAGGRSTSVKQSMLPAAFTASSSNLLSVKGAVNTRAVVSIRRSDNSGQSLFWVTWDGAIRPFDATLPSGVDEYVSSANYGDTRLAWWRNSHVSSSSIDAALLGLFELDLASMTNQALTNLNNTNADCYDPTVDTYYKLSGSTLLSCSCNTGSCISLVSPPAPNETAWAPVVTLSPQRGIVGYNYDWLLDRMPQSTAMAQLYNAQGSLIANVDAGTFQYDRLDQVVVAIGTALSSSTDAAFVSAATGHVTPVTGGRAIIMYEQ